MPILIWLGYRRVSRVGDRAETLISPEQQAEEIDRYARSRKLQVEILPPELDVSGAKLERPILGDALERIDRGEAAGIIVRDLSRLSRRTKHMLDLVERIESAGGRLVSVKEDIDTSTPAGRLQRDMISVVNEFQQRGTAEHIAASKASAVERGIWPVHVVPLGYRKGADRRLEPDPVKAPVVVEAFKARAAGKPWGQVADILGFSYSGANKVVSNRVYLGELRLGELVNTTAHPPLVDRRLFEAAQLDHARPPRGKHPPALLTGILRCAGCRHTLGASTYGGGKRAYKCTRMRHTAGRCQEPAFIAAKYVEPVVEEGVLRLVEDARFTFRQRTANVRDAQERLARAEAELAIYQEATSVLDAGVDAFRIGLRSRAEKVETLRAQVGAGRRQVEGPFGTDDLREIWTQLGVIERRQALRAALGVVWVRRGKGPERARAVAAGFEPMDLPRSGIGGGGGPVLPLVWDDELEGEIRLPKLEELLDSTEEAGA